MQEVCQKNQREPWYVCMHSTTIIGFTIFEKWNCRTGGHGQKIIGNQFLMAGQGVRAPFGNFYRACQPGIVCNMILSPIPERRWCRRQNFDDDKDSLTNTFGQNVFYFCNFCTNVLYLNYLWMARTNIVLNPLSEGIDHTSKPLFIRFQKREPEAL